MGKFKGFRADRLNEVMKEHGVTEEELAEVFNSVWIMRQLFDDMYIPAIRDLFMICDICNCSADYLLGLSDNVN